MAHQQVQRRIPNPQRPERLIWVRKGFNTRLENLICIRFILDEDNDSSEDVLPSGR